MKRLIDLDDAQLAEYMASVLPRDEDGFTPCRFFLAAMGDDTGHIYCLSNMQRQQTVQILREIADRSEPSKEKPKPPARFHPPM